MSLLHPWELRNPVLGEAGHAVSNAAVTSGTALDGYLPDEIPAELAGRYRLIRGRYVHSDGRVFTAVFKPAPARRDSQEEGLPGVHQFPPDAEVPDLDNCPVIELGAREAAQLLAAGVVERCQK